MKIKVLLAVSAVGLLAGCVVAPGSVPYPSYTTTTPYYYGYQPTYQASAYPVYQTQTTYQPVTGYQTAQPYPLYSPEGAPANANQGPAGTGQ